MENRDEILKLDDSALSARCELEFFKGTGNGGQKRNKTSSAARVRLPEFGVAAEDCTERSQHRNRAAALRKLRLAVAYQVRQSPATPPERVECAVDHADYPFMLAHLLDLLEEEKWELKPAAERCGLSATALVKRLARDPELWSFANRERLRFGHCPLRKP